MPDQEESVYQQNTSNTTHTIDNEESRKVDGELKIEEKISIGSKSQQGERTDNKESEKINDTEQNFEDGISSEKTSKQGDGKDCKESRKIGNTEQKPEDIVISDETYTQEHGTDNKEFGKIDGELNTEGKICVINKSRIEDGSLLSLKINSVESGKRNNTILLEDETCINNKADSEENLPPTNIDDKYTDEMWLCNFGTLENTVNSRKRHQNENEGLDDNKLILLKKIKIEDTIDDRFHEMWKYLQYDFSNFNTWINLLQLIDDHNIEAKARLAYSKFLELYPLCYGYWKKYANFEKRNDNIHEFEEVIQNGLSAIPISVDLWIYYMKYLRTERYDEEHHIRNEFERSLKMCGLHYRSDQLWYDYISWEVERNEIFNAAKLYYRLIRTPTLNHWTNFFKFQEFIFKKLPEEYLGHEEYFKRRNLIIQSLTSNHYKELLNDVSLPPGEDFQHEPQITENDILLMMRIEIMDMWHYVHKETAEEFGRRTIFEENIRRPHFHVNELESAQIKNWENYIKFERRDGNHERIIFLYERCLIACVSNEKIWLSYLEYLSSVDFDVTVLLSDVFKRALFHHPKSLLLNLKYFDFSVTQGLVETAVETIANLEILDPDSMKVAIKTINLARKKQDGILAMLYKHNSNCLQLKSFTSYIAVRYARFVWKHDHQLNLAFDILNDTIRNNDISVNDSLEIYLALVELKMELTPKDHLSIFKTIDDIISQCNLYKDKRVFSKKKIEYAEDYIQDYDILRLAKIEYKKIKNACSRERRQSSNNAM